MSRVLENLEGILAGPSQTTTFDQFISDEPAFTADTQAEIKEYGLSNWLLRQEKITLEDSVFDWRTMPTVMRQVLMADIFQGLPLGMVKYAIPIRKLNQGRVFILAIMPQGAPAPIQVVTQTRPVLAIQPRVFDPPVPVLAMGLASPVICGYQARLLKRVIEGNFDAIGTLLEPIMSQLAQSGQATISEAVYYAVSMHNLITGAWRQFEHYWPIVQADEIVNRLSQGQDPTLPQRLIYDGLVEGRPIRWGQLDRVLVEPE